MGIDEILELRAIEYHREEGREKGREEEKVKNKKIVQALTQGLVTPEQIASDLDVTLEEVLDWKQTMGL